MLDLPQNPTQRQNLCKKLDDSISPPVVDEIDQDQSVVQGTEKLEANCKIKSKKKKKKQKRTLMKANLPNEIRSNPQLLKYWYRRFQLFHKFDEGIQLDAGKLVSFLMVKFRTVLIASLPVA